MSSPQGACRDQLLDDFLMSLASCCVERGGSLVNCQRGSPGTRTGPPQETKHVPLKKHLRSGGPLGV